MQTTTYAAQAAKYTAAPAGKVQQLFPIFQELAFMRLSDSWMPSKRDAGLMGGNAFDGKVFRQFQLKYVPSVTLDFWFRGRRLHPIAALSFQLTLKYVHALKEMELEIIREALGIVGTGVPSRRQVEKIAHIHLAEVGNLNGKLVLAVRWDNLKTKRQFISLFIDAEGDGATVHEVHFSAPPEQFAETKAHLTELLRSIQWAEVSPPPLAVAA
ncbi:MAG TPA: hypothetical protein V6D08_15745 [Candidatus Obscuribacterales bacterium]